MDESLRINPVAAAHGISVPQTNTGLIIQPLTKIVHPNSGHADIIRGIISSLEQHIDKHGFADYQAIQNLQTKIKVDGKDASLWCWDKGGQCWVFRTDAAENLVFKVVDPYFNHVRIFDETAVDMEIVGALIGEDVGIRKVNDIELNCIKGLIPTTYLKLPGLQGGMVVQELGSAENISDADVKGLKDFFNSKELFFEDKTRNVRKITLEDGTTLPLNVDLGCIRPWRGVFEIERRYPGYKQKRLQELQAISNSK